eukprot:scaffold994_cov226-Prasinococcus_capsulatus_cf.AAC.27
MALWRRRVDTPLWRHEPIFGLQVGLPRMGGHRALQTWDVKREGLKGSAPGWARAGRRTGGGDRGRANGRLRRGRGSGGSTHSFSVNSSAGRPWCRAPCVHLEDIGLHTRIYIPTATHASTKSKACAVRACSSLGNALGLTPRGPSGTADGECRVIQQGRAAPVQVRSHDLAVLLEHRLRVQRRLAAPRLHSVTSSRTEVCFGCAWVAAEYRKPIGAAGHSLSAMEAEHSAMEVTSPNGFLQGVHSFPPVGSMKRKLTQDYYCSSGVRVTWIASLDCSRVLRAGHARGAAQRAGESFTFPQWARCPQQIQVTRTHVVSQSTADARTLQLAPVLDGCFENGQGPVGYRVGARAPVSAVRNYCPNPRLVRQCVLIP